MFPKHERRNASQKIMWWPQRDPIELPEFKYAISLRAEPALTRSSAASLTPGVPLRGESRI